MPRSIRKIPAMMGWKEAVPPGGPFLPGSVSNLDNPSGSFGDWTDIDNVKLDDGLLSTNNYDSNSGAGSTEYIYGSQLGFNSLPQNANITNIKIIANLKDDNGRTDQLQAGPYLNGNRMGSAIGTSSVSLNTTLEDRNVDWDPNANNSTRVGFVPKLVSQNVFGFAFASRKDGTGTEIVSANTLSMELEYDTNSQVQIRSNPGSVSLFSGTAWNNTGNLSAENGSEADCTTSNNVNTGQLDLTDWGFSIPGGATIKGIVFISKIRESTVSGTYNGTETVFRSIKGGVTHDLITSTEIVEDGSLYWTGAGTPDFLWSTTWSPTDINATSFGTRVYMNGGISGGSATYYIDNIQAMVYYTT